MVQAVRLLVFGLLIPALSHAAPPKFASLSGGFDKFIAESANADFDTQLKSWQKNIESLYPEVYLHVLAGNDPSKLDEKRRELATLAFPFIFAHATEISDQFHIFETNGRSIINRLVTTYPQADMANVEVLGLLSLNKFNGQVITIADKQYVMFGLDMIAQINAKPDFIQGAVLINDLQVLVAHEFTHALQSVLSSSSGSGGLLDPLWGEGLAQANSQLLIPGTLLENVYMEKILAEKCTPENIGPWSKDFIQDSTANDSDQQADYPKWFMLKPQGLSSFGVYRAGYCIGYNVILYALRQYSMNDILNMPQAKARQIAQSALAEMANTSESKSSGAIVKAESISGSGSL